MSGKFRFRDIFLIVILILIAAVFLDMFRRDLLFTFNLQNMESVGTVVIKRNTVQRRLGSRVLWDRLTRQSPVYIWDLIRVADASAATLYIQGNSIDLEENTLVQLRPAPDGKSIQISMSYGTISVLSGYNTGSIIIDLNGQKIRPEPGSILNITMTEDGQVLSRILESITREISKPHILSPSPDSLLLYNRNLPVVNFQWTEVEGAVSYIIEVSDTPDLVNPRIRKQTSAVFFSDSSLGDGTWFWRVTPVFPPVYGSSKDVSSAASFRIEKTDDEIDNPAISFPQWLVMMLPRVRVQEAAAPVSLPPPPPRPTPPATVTLLASPQNLRPSNGTNFGIEELSGREIVFNWTAVPGANAYIYTLFQQTAEDRRQIIRETISGTSYTIDNLQLLELDIGSFYWEVEAINRTGNTTRRGRPAGSMFIIDFPLPGPIYGVEIIYD